MTSKILDFIFGQDRCHDPFDLDFGPFASQEPTPPDMPLELELAADMAQSLLIGLDANQAYPEPGTLAKLSLDYAQALIREYVTRTAEQQPTEEGADNGSQA